MNVIKYPTMFVSLICAFPVILGDLRSSKLEMNGRWLDFIKESVCNRKSRTIKKDVGIVVASKSISLP
jgi:hypothetical protein